jgi:hypothetical protein
MQIKAPNRIGEYVRFVIYSIRPQTSHDRRAPIVHWEVGPPALDYLRCSATVDQSEICLKSGEGLRLAEIGSQGDFTRVDIR